MQTRFWGAQWGFNLKLPNAISPYVSTEVGNKNQHGEACCAFECQLIMATPLLSLFATAVGSWYQVGRAGQELDTVTAVGSNTWLWIRT